jgi:hypothetical protein
MRDLPSEGVRLRVPTAPRFGDSTRTIRAANPVEVFEWRSVEQHGVGEV